MLFGAGSGACIGAAFAMMAKISLAMILQRFRITVVPNSVIDRKVFHARAQIRLTDATHLSGSPLRQKPVRGTIHEMVDLS